MPGRIRLFIFLLWLVVLLFYSYTALRVPDRSSFISPDENNTFTVARSVEERGTIYLTSSLNQRFGVDYFRGRNYVETSPDTYTSFNSLGLSLLVGAAMEINLEWMVVPLLASLGVLGVFLIGRRLGGGRAGLLAAVLFGLLPTNLFNSNLLLDITASVSPYLLAVGLVLECFHTRSRAAAFAGGCMLGLSFFVRQSLAVCILLLLLWVILNARRFSPRLLLPMLTPAALIAAGTLLLNKSVYGSYLSTGQFSVSGKSSVGALFNPVDISSILRSVYTHVAQYLPLLLLLGLAGFALSLARKRGWPLLTFHLFLALLALSTLSLFGSRSGTWSFEQFDLSASMARYFTPVYAVLAIYAAVFLARALDMGKRTLASLVLLATVCSYLALSFGTVAHTDLPYLKERLTDYTSRKQTLLLQEADHPVVVFTKSSDKDLYDDLEVGICYTENDLELFPGLASLTIPIVDVGKDVMPVLEKLRKEGWLVLVTSDATEVMEACEAAGYKLEMIQSWPRTYKVRKIKK